MSGLLEIQDGMGEWRESRDSWWFYDIGYVFEEIVRGHRYDYHHKGVKQDDPGWHACSCGKWQGYWSGHESHVVDHLRAAMECRAGLAPNGSER